MLLILMLFIGSNVVDDFNQHTYKAKHNVVTPVKGDVYTFVSFTDHKD